MAKSWADATSASTKRVPSPSAPEAVVVVAAALAVGVAASAAGAAADVADAAVVAAAGGKFRSAVTRPGQSDLGFEGLESLAAFKPSLHFLGQN